MVTHKLGHQFWIDNLSPFLNENEDGIGPNFNKVNLVDNKLSGKIFTTFLVFFLFIFLMLYFPYLNNKTLKLLITKQKEILILIYSNYSHLEFVQKVSIL